MEVVAAARVVQLAPAATHGLRARPSPQPIFYFAFFAYFLVYFVAMAMQAGSPGAIQQTGSDSEALVAQLGFLPNGTLGGAPWVPGRTCLQLPPYYDFEASTSQRMLIPLVYAFMHGALTAVSIMPLPLCYAFWTRVVAAMPSVRRVVPIGKTTRASALAWTSS